MNRKNVSTYGAVASMLAVLVMGPTCPFQPDDTTDEQICGGLTGAACDEGEYCLYPEGTCGAADQTGVCTAIPDDCPDLYEPVCGCDDETYMNECEAAAAGVSIVAQGECEEASVICGGLIGALCDEGEYCMFEEGVCGEGDQTGVCTTVPEVCTEEYAPVCGCDGETYGNACFAAAAGVSIAAQGECEPESEICGGIAAIVCPDGQYCLYEEGVCGEGDQSGVCAEIPESCTMEYLPVCGCDGETYGNACAAAVAGVSIAAQGECAEENGVQ